MYIYMYIYMCVYIYIYIYIYMYIYLDLLSMALHSSPYLVDEINAATAVLLLLCLHCICCCG